MLFADAFMDAFGGLVGLFSFGFVILVIIYFLFPFIVMLQLIGLNEKLARLADEASLQKKVVEELQHQNNLTRQLLKAYGHEPEA